MQTRPLTASKLAEQTESVVLAARSNEEESWRRNPFTLPTNCNIFLLRKQDRECKTLEQHKKLKMMVQERGLYVTRKKASQAELWCELRAGREELAANEEASELRDNPAWRLARIKNRNIEKESTTEFISMKRELFLLEYVLAVKQEEIERLEKVAIAEEKKLARAEKLLEKDSIMFDEFLKESDKNSVEAIKIAEQESKIRQEKVSEIKRIAARMVAIKSDITKLEDTLKEYSMYKDFLYKLSPPEWQQEQLARRKGSPRTLPVITEKDEGKNAGQKRVESRATTTKKELPPLRNSRQASRHSIKTDKLSPRPSMESWTEEVNLSDNESFTTQEELEMYFTDPKQLLDLLTDLEEQNLSLIQNSRETEESLEDLRQVLDQTRKKMEKETEQLLQQIGNMTQNIKQEEDRAIQLEINARLFSYGKYKDDDQDSMLDMLGQKVQEVYRCCIGDSEGNLSTLQMLTAIEGRLGELLENVDSIPHDRVLMAVKAKERERRIRQREEKITQQKKHQEERIQKALERAQADIAKSKGKKLMVRSHPPEHRKKVFPNTDLADREREEHLYFFT